MAREILAIQGLENTTPAFRKKLIEVADRRGLDPSYLAAVIAFESAGSFSPSIRNSLSRAVGLIQFTKGAAKQLGTTRDELAMLTAEEQLDWVEKYYARVDKNKQIRTIEDHYMAVLGPAWLFKPNETPTYVRPPEGCPLPLTGSYCQNKGLDHNDDGIITKTEASAGVHRIINIAKNKPPIIVDMAAAPPSPPIYQASSGAVNLLPLAAAAIVGYFGVTYVMRRRKRR